MVEDLETRQMLTAFVVTTAQDDTTPDSVTSLREAIIAANQNPGADTITIDSSLSGQTFVLGQSQLEISDPVTITGLGATNTVIDAQTHSRVFNMTSTAGDVTLIGLTITGGLTEVDDASGAGIRYLGTGTLTLVDSAVSVNATTGLNSQGAGIATNAGKVVLIGSTVSGNSTSGANAPGGGIATGSGDITLINSTISSNATGNNNSGGGGISTFNGKIKLTNTTVAFNLTSGSNSPGGGIQSNGTGGANATNTIVINNSIVAKNSSTSTTSEDITKGTGTTSLSANGSLIGVNTGSGLPAAPLGSPDGSGNLIGTNATPIDPKLDTLALNGGTTKSHALLTSSPAIDGGINILALDNTGTLLTEDQTGNPRIFHGTVDMGAYELQAIVPPPTVSFTLASQSAGEGAGVFLLTVSLSAVTTKNVSVPFTTGGTAINGFDYTIASSPLTIPAGSTSATIAVTIIDDTAVDGNKTLVVTLGSPTNATLGSITSDTLTITDNDNGAPTNIVLSSNTVPENATNVVVGTLTATDPNVGDTATFSIQPGGQGALFTISGNQLKVGATGLNFEALPGGIATVTIRATDGTGLFLDKQFNINVSDVNETPAINAGQTFSVPEASPVNTVVGTVAATDPDTVAPNSTLTYSIVSGNTSNAFAINASTGQITVSNSAALNPATNPTFTLQIKVVDGGAPSLSATQNVTITVTDANEAPSITAGQVFTTAENRSTGAVVGTVQATDPDPTAPNKTLTYSILSGNTNNAFTINTSTGQLTIRTPSAVDFETTPQFTLTIQVIDGGSPALSATGTVTINVTDVNETPTIPSGQVFSVVQNAPTNTVVGTVSASDPDTTAPNNTLIFTITGGNTGSAFQINAATGVITVANSAALNPQLNPQFSLQVRVADGGSPSLSVTQTVTINVTVANRAPVVNPQTFTLPENSAAGTSVGTVVATDPDTTAPNNTLTYSIIGGNTGNAFAINSATGQLTVNTASAVNFEVTSQFSLQVQVSDGGTPSLSTTQTITVNLTDVNEAPTVTAGQSFTVNENSASSTVVGTVEAIDPDVVAPNKTLTYTILSGNTNNAFAINSATGQITVSNPSALNFSLNSSWTLQVRASDGGTPSLSSTQNVTITLVDVNQSPSFPAGQTFTISDNAAANAVVGTVIATDPDATAPNKTLTFSILSGNTGNAFAINATTGQITVLTPGVLDANTTPQYSLQVQVADGGNPSLTVTRTVIVNVLPPNQSPSVPSGQNFSIQENTAVNVAVGQVVATDPDSTYPNNTLFYSIIGGNTNNAFVINSSTGVISVASSAALNFETTPTISLQVRVVDGGAPPLSATQIVTIHITDVNEAPSIAANQSFTVNESSPNSTVVGTVVATDPDIVPPNSTLTYSILSGNANGAFAINPATGQLTVSNSGALVFANGALYTLQIQVADGGGVPLTATQNVTVSLVDVNETPVINPGQSFNIDENSTAGTVVGSVVASDPDATSPNNTLTYSITDGNTNGAFAIDPTTGQITVSNPAAVNFESTLQFTLFIRVADGGTPSLSTTQTVLVNVNDLDELPQIPAGQSFTLDEHSANGTVVGTVTASDPDIAAPNNTLTYSIDGGNPGGAFAIDPTTGQVTVANSAAVDAAVNPQFALVVRVTDGGSPLSTTTQVVTITLNDVNEIPSIPSGQVFSVAENQPTGAAVGTVVAIDPDPTSPNNTLTYNIVGGNGLNVFSINSVTGQLTINNPAGLNFEVTPQFVLQIEASDGATPSLTTINSVTINVTDVNEAPVIPVGQTFTIAENQAANSAVGTVTATDPDTTAPANTLSYSISGGNTGNAFAINSTTGAVTVSNSAALDFESTPSFTLQITVTDGGGLSTTQTVTVDLTDVNETPAIASGQVFSVAELAANSTVVGTVVASDPDQSAPNSTLAYAIDSGNTNGAFAINPTTGQITVANSAALNFSNGASYTLQISVTDGGTPGLTATQSVTVNLVDVNETPTISAGQLFTLNENPTNGQSVGTVTASDPDATAPNNTLTYSIVGGNTSGAFAINSATGEITVANSSAVNFEVNPQFNLQIQVTDGGNPALTATGGVTVAVGDVNEAPSIPANQVLTVAEDAVVSTVVGTVNATDPDTSSPNNVLTYSIVSGNTDNTFAINPATGQIRVNSTTTLDFETTPAYTLAITVTDGGSLTATQNVTINVTNANDAPVLGNSGTPPVYIHSQNTDLVVVPNITVSDVDSATDLAQIVINLPATSAKKSKDTINLIGLAALGTATDTINNGLRQITIALNVGVTNAQVESFLRGITFSTKGKGLKQTPRDIQVRVVDRQGASSNVITQSIQVRKK